MQSQAIYVGENLKKSLHILEDGAKWCASGDIDQLIVTKKV